KTKGVAYRAVFIIDLEGILRFSAVYPLDVGRSVREVERIIKVLQRARELSQIGGLAIRFHCHGRHSAHLRDYRDIDLFGLSREKKAIGKLMKKLGYSPNVEFN